MDMMRFLGIAGAVLCATVLMPATVHAQECFPAPEDLIGWWDGDAVSASTAFDLQGNFDGSLEGALTDFGRVGQAFSVDGIVGTGVRVPSDSALDVSHITMDAWIKPFSFQNPFPKIMVRNTTELGATQYLLAVTDSGEAHCNIGTFATPVAGSIPLNAWTHIACTYDRQNARLYVNGSEVAVVPATTAIPGSSRELWIGREEPAPALASFPRHFDGLIDEVELFDRALTAGEILAIFEAGTAGKCKDEDGDGFRPPEDCDESDAAVNPGAVELPGNFVDENCDGSLGDVDPCFDWKNHGEYVRSVAHAVDDLVAAGALTEEEGDALVSSAAMSKIGKKGFVPPECP